MSGLAEMYQDYIDGKREILDINMEFKARYESGDEGPEKADKHLLNSLLEKISMAELKNDRCVQIIIQ